MTTISIEGKQYKLLRLKELKGSIACDYCIFNDKPAICGGVNETNLCINDMHTYWEEVEVDGQ